MEVLTNRIYKHFKGDYYIVLDIAIHTETKEKMVIYRSLYENGQLYVRPYNSFISAVDKNKYPQSNQQYKFEIQNIKSVVKR